MPDLPISKKQLDKLGDRLRDSDEPAPDDLALLARALDAYAETLSTVVSELRGMGFSPSVRLKTSETTIDKLRRERRSSLKTIHDLAGARVTLTGDLNAQDVAVRGFCDRYRDADPQPYVIDRRLDPRSGYRAVHVVVKVDTVPVEVQFRTEMQDLWAQVFERIGDAWGRQIRYGGDPDPDPLGSELTAARKVIVANMAEVSQEIAGFEADVTSMKLGLGSLEQGAPEQLRRIGSTYWKAEEARRSGEAVIRRGLGRVNDLVERDWRSR